ncbi:conserved exported hypothetical protein [Bradyrhizobium sp. STM 3843]|uniref:c-type cytochrome n=1 Tax=Bradyrhizobium sp. STM 3843 TaxID=551947 RepID=UPI000240AEE9|nr:c-type cytochrome [Bradyrhizobium sp. STM 3843]CCE05652.1 conserved exported hypothetical protein [Bradyrhizobium sp. STM 3843]
MSEIYEAAIPLLAALLLVWITWRAWRKKHPLLKWAGTVAAAVLTAAATAASALALLGFAKLGARSAPQVSVQVAGTTDQIERGREISDGFCSGCHSQTGTLTGGRDLGHDIPLPIGSFVATNLTPAGALARWSDGDIFRAIRNGVGADGRWLIIMSYTNAGKLSDWDTLAVIAYLRSLPPAGSDTGRSPDRLSLLGLLMLGAGQLPAGKPIIRGAVSSPPRGPTREFGEYILSYQDCRECHGPRLTGGTPGQLPPLGPDLGIVKGWSFDQFQATMRSGIDPNGHQLAETMPWQPIGRMADDELRAIYAYLINLPSE